MASLTNEDTEASLKQKKTSQALSIAVRHISGLFTHN
jgi:hypothetical protein